MAYPFVGGSYPHQDYIPHKYSPKLLEKYHDNTILTKITNSDYVGEFRNGGDSITIRKRPDIKTFRYRVGQALAYTDLKTDSMTVKVERMRAYAFKINSIEEKLTDLKGFVSEWTNEAAISLDIDTEKEFFGEAPTMAGEFNQGSEAGRVSKRYNLGTSGTPLSIVQGATSSGDVNVVEAIVNANAAMAEEPGWDGQGAFIILPVWMATLLKLSDLHKADMMGDTQTTLRADVNAIGRVGGFDIYQSNLLPIDPTDKTTPILFGNRRAITYANTISITEVKDNPYEPGKLHSSVMVYDWFSTHPEFLGVMYAKPKSA